MPNIKSSIKRVKVTRAKTLRNRMIKSSLRTAIRKCREAINSNDPNAKKVLEETMKVIDRAAAKNVIHKNTAARKKSRLAKALNKLAASANN